MSFLTLLEASKRGLGTQMERAVVQIFARQAKILQFLPFQSIPGNAIKYNREDTLPGVAFRGVNESFTPSHGVLNPITESLVIIGGEISIDNFILQTEGADTRSVHEAMKIKAIAQDWQLKFFKGDSESDPKEFDGLQKRITGDQLIANGGSSGGDPLSLAKLDEAIDNTLEPTALIMSKAVARLIGQGARKDTVGGLVNFEVGNFGQRVMSYDGLPIITMEDLNGQDNVLEFNEAGSGGGSTATSIYVLSFGPERVMGIQNGSLSARDLGESDTTPHRITRIEWYAGLMIKHGRAVTRLSSISNAAVVA